LDPSQNKIILVFRARLHRNHRTCETFQKISSTDEYYKAWTLGVRHASNM